MDVPYQQLFERCGSKLSEVKVNQILERCEKNRRDCIGGTPKVGSVVDGYKILGYLGSGRSGTACFAFKNELYFVIKFMRVDDSQRGPTKEYKILRAQLESNKHENCLTALEWKEWTEWKDFDSKDVKQKLRDRKEKLRYMVIKLAGIPLNLMRAPDSLSFSIKQGINLMKKSLLAIQSLHEDNLIHRDLKSDNMAVDIDNEERVVILDYGLVCKAPQVETKTAKTYRHDYKAWFKIFFEFAYAIGSCSSIAHSSEEGIFWSTPNAYAVQIVKHINHLQFRQKMNFYFIQECLQNIYDEANGIRLIPYVYKKVSDFSKIIVHGNYEFSGKQNDKKGRRQFICRSCRFSIYVDIAEFKEAEDGSNATIVNTLHEHHECTQN